MGKHGEKLRYRFTFVYDRQGLGGTTMRNQIGEQKFTNLCSDAIIYDITNTKPENWWFRNIVKILKCSDYNY